MKRSRILVVLIVVVIVVIAVVAIVLRARLRCAGFAGPGVGAEDLPAGPPAAGSLRVVAWNVRNFPLDDRPQEPDLGYFRRTNICDLEEALRGLEADILGFEEIRDTRRFPPILRRAGGEKPYRIVFSRGGGRHGQHVGIAWDDTRLRLVRGPLEIAEVALQGQYRPALAAYLGSRAPGGVDLTVVQVHLAATPKGFEERLQQYQILAEWVQDWVAEVGDEDVVVQGDFNTTGSPEGIAAEERDLADSILARAGLRRLDNATGCSSYWEGPGERDGVQISSLIDLVYVRGLEELDAEAELRSWLHCARLDCAELVSEKGFEDATYWDVSDHCPLSFEIEDRDVD
jgi:endonuclease/exonuclease/phosphatase family metal-dependent hydrolase